MSTLTDSFVVGDTVIEVSLMDIVSAEVEIIVSSVCSELHLGNGVLNSIIRAGGSQIYDSLLEQGKGNEIRPGNVVITSAGELNCDYIYHAISSDCITGASTEILQDCINNCLKFAERQKVSTIAFPALSTGEMYFEAQEAARILVNTVVEYCANNKGYLKKVVFCLVQPHVFIKFFREAVRKSVFINMDKLRVYPATQQDRLLMEQLNCCERGKRDWRLFENIVVDILNELFVPPLMKPKIQGETSNKLHRRDALYPNYAENGFWKIVDERYSAPFVLVECKNETEDIGPDSVYQVSRYLNSKTIGKFALLVSRTMPSSQAVVARREAYEQNGMIILFLYDFDLIQMLQHKRVGADASEYLRTQLNDFLLGY